MSVKPIPDGYPSVTPYLIVKGAAQAIDFYKSVFGAKERLRIPASEGRVAHAEIEIGGSVVMLADECPERGVNGPHAAGRAPLMIHLYIEDSDKVFAKAIAGGAKQVRAMETQFYGDRSGMFQDPFGHEWNVATHVEDVSMEEMNKRMAAMSAKK